MSDTWKKIVKPVKKLIPKDLNILSPDFDVKFTSDWFTKVDLSDLFKFSVPSAVSLASNVYASFHSKMSLKSSFLTKG